MSPRASSRGPLPRRGIASCCRGGFVLRASASTGGCFFLPPRRLQLGDFFFLVAAASSPRGPLPRRGCFLLSPWCLHLADLRLDGRASSCRRGGFISRALPRRGMLLLVTAAASSRGPLPRRGVLPLAWCLRLVGVGPPGLARVLVGRWRRTVPMAQVPRGCSGGSQRDGAEVGRGRPGSLGAAPKAGQRGLVLVGRGVSWAVRSARLVRSCASCLSSGGLSSPPGPSLSSPAARGGSR